MSRHTMTSHLEYKKSDHEVVYWFSVLMVNGSRSLLVSWISIPPRVEVLRGHPPRVEVLRGHPSRVEVLRGYLALRGDRGIWGYPLRFHNGEDIVCTC